MVKDTKKWTIYDKKKIIKERMNNTSHCELEEKFRNDPKCSNRTIEAIKHKEREWNLDIVREIHEHEIEEHEQKLQEKNEEIEELKEDLQEKNEEIEELKKEFSAEKSKMSYNYNETIVYQIETNDSLKHQLKLFRDAFKSHKRTSENTVKNLKIKVDTLTKSEDLLKREANLASKIKQGKVIIIPSYLINIFFLLYFHSFFLSLFDEIIDNVLNTDDITKDFCYFNETF